LADRPEASCLRQNPQSSITALGSERKQPLSGFANESTMWSCFRPDSTAKNVHTFPDYNRLRETAATQCYLSKGKDLCCLLYWKHGIDYLALTYSWVKKKKKKKEGRKKEIGKSEKFHNHCLCPIEGN